MKTIIVSFLLLIATNSLQAQNPCSDESIMAVVGKWAKRPDATMKPGNQLAITTRVDKMQQLLQAAYPNPRGMEANWYRSMGGHYSSPVKSSESYELNALFKAYYCNKHLAKQMLSIEASTSFDIWANKFKWFASEANENFRVDNKPVYLLTRKLGELKGFTLFAGSDNGTPNTGQQFSKTILISRTGQLPYIPVTRKQYLLTFLKNKEEWQNKYEASLLQMKVRSDAEEEIYKNQQLERVVNQAGNEQSKEKAKANFLKGYKTAKQRQQEDINRAKEVYQRDIKAALDYMNTASVEELAKPAYMSNTSYEGSFLKFADEKSGMMLAQVNEDYFNKKLPAYAPQFVIAYWRWNTEKPSLDFANQIENNFNFKALQEMLDK